MVSVVQRATRTDLQAVYGLSFNAPYTAGNTLVAYHSRSQNTVPSGVQDTAGNAWSEITQGAYGIWSWALWSAVAKPAAGVDTVSFDPGLGGYNTTITLLEIGGLAPSQPVSSVITLSSDIPPTLQFGASPAPTILPGGVGRPLPTIDNSLVRYDVGPPQFEALVGSMLGNAADSSDGWDADIGAVMALFDAMDKASIALDPQMYELGVAMDDFRSIDVTSVFSDALAAVPALTSFLDSAKLQAVGGLALGGLPPPPGGGEPIPPPTVCVPAGDSSSSSSPPPGPSSSSSSAPPPPCPKGWVRTTAGDCQPPPVPHPDGPPNPPVILPPLPAGVPPCPPGFVSTDSGDCMDMRQAGSGYDFILPLADTILRGLSAEQTTAAAMSWVGTFGLTGAAAIPIAGAIIGVAVLIVGLLGGSCGAPCVVASKIEQVYEAVTTNLYQIAKAGMLGSYEALAGIYHFNGIGYQALTRLGTQAGQEGYTNLAGVTLNLANAARTLPTAATKPLTLAAARALYVGGPGWYADSLDAATKLTDQFVRSYIYQQTGIMPA